MATISITVPDAAVDRVAAAFAAKVVAFGGQAPATAAEKRQLVKDELAAYVRQVVGVYEARLAAEAAEQQARAAVDGLSIA